MAAFTNTEFEFGGINHLALTCSDMQRTVDFYTNILGTKLVKTLEFTHDAQFIAVCSGLRLNCELRISDPVQR